VRRTIAMPLVLSLPGLLARDRLPRALALARLIALAGAPRRDDGGIAAALAPRYGVRRQTDWPLAAVRARALGVDTGDAYWLATTPVAMTAGAADVRVDGAIRDLGGEDARMLIAALNAHFAEDGLLFVAPRPEAWFVRSPATPDLATQPLDAALARPVRELMPAGRDARTWWRYQNEIQMLLFEHPVNVARARAGRPPVNSVWFEYGGTMPVRDAAVEPVETWSNDATIAALAAFAGNPARPAPASLDAAQPKRDATSAIAIDPPIDLEAFDRAFAAAALAALERGALDSVAVVSDGAGAALEWTATRPSRWSRWTRRFDRRDLAQLLSAHR
jgi:hypothetical protein